MWWFRVGLKTTTSHKTRSKRKGRFRVSLGFQRVPSGLGFGFAFKVVRKPNNGLTKKAGELAGGSPPIRTQMRIPIEKLPCHKHDPGSAGDSEDVAKPQKPPKAAKSHQRRKSQKTTPTQKKQKT